ERLLDFRLPLRVVVGRRVEALEDADRDRELLLLRELGRLLQDRLRLALRRERLLGLVDLGPDVPPPARLAELLGVSAEGRERRLVVAGLPLAVGLRERRL